MIKKIVLSCVIALGLMFSSLSKAQASSCGIYLWGYCCSGTWYKAWTNYCGYPVAGPGWTRSTYYVTVTFDYWTSTCAPIKTDQFGDCVDIGHFNGGADPHPPSGWDHVTITVQGFTYRHDPIGCDWTVEISSH